jgi:hypothetical protein
MEAKTSRSAVELQRHTKLVFKQQGMKKKAEEDL